MLITQNLPSILGDSTKAVIIEANKYSVPRCTAEGMFTVDTSLPFEWSTAAIINVEYSAKTRSFIKGSDAETNATVTPAIQAIIARKIATSGLVEAHISYHKRANTTAYNGAMHESLVSGGMTEWAHNMAIKVDRSILSNYEDIGHRQKGLKGLNDYGVELNEGMLDPSMFSAVYKFFATQIARMKSALQIDSSDITLFIAENAVVALNSQIITDGGGMTIWEKIKSSLLSNIKIFQLNSPFVMDNRCVFVANSFATLYKPDVTFFVPKPEKVTTGNEQYIRYLEYVLPSLVITNTEACLRQEELVDMSVMSMRNAQIDYSSELNRLESQKKELESQKKDLESKKSELKKLELENEKKASELNSATKKI
jgi:hypothetical protein